MCAYRNRPPLLDGFLNDRLIEIAYGSTQYGFNQGLIEQWDEIESQVRVHILSQLTLEQLEVLLESVGSEAFLPIWRECQVHREELAEYSPSVLFSQDLENVKNWAKDLGVPFEELQAHLYTVFPSIPQQNVEAFIKLLNGQEVEIPRGSFEDLYTLADHTLADHVLRGLRLHVLFSPS